MDVKERTRGDRELLAQLAKRERNGKQRDRFIAVGMALDGEFTEDIMERLERSKNFVQRWTYAYRDRGIDGLTPKKNSGRPSKLKEDQIQQLKARLNAGPTQEDGVCTLRGRDIVRIIKQTFDQEYSLNGVYRLLHSMGYSCLKPRPRHEKNDPKAMEDWVKQAPLFSSTSASSTPARRSKSGSRTRHASGRRAP